MMDKYAFLRMQKSTYVKNSQRLQNPDIQDKVGNFLLRYILIETLYKKLLSAKMEAEYSRKLSKRELNSLTVQAPEVCEVLDYYGITYDKSLVRRVFGFEDDSYKTCTIKKLRNRLVHGISNAGIDAVIERYDSLNADLNAFMELFD